ncbi:MAG: Stp1/IreP family PP2C-type Ser/Thr phosphatase [Actinomycetota bacterium]|nr:Stp1/IreP family PP2C-type Ser/Thr phosphatase [Actinomycetota bacterium]
MKTVVGAKSDVGRVREGNEDAYLVQEPLFAVADGMGGHVAGDVASQTAIETITEKAADREPRETTALESLIKEANAAIWSKAQEEPSLRGMGTTCTLIVVDDSQAHIGHVGDSRAYLFREGELSQLTEDHTLVGRMVREGRLRPEEAERHPQRSIITRVLGVDEDVQVDTASIPVKEGDRLLICSDGLTSMLDVSEIRQVLADEPDPQAAVDRLVDLANDAGGEDNVTAVVLAFDPGVDGSSRGVTPSARVETEPGLDPDAADAAPPLDAPPAGESDDLTRAALPPTAKPARDARRRRGSPIARVLISFILIAAILGVGGYLGFRYLWVANSYFVGVNEDGVVAIFQGLPEEVAGMSFQEEKESSDVRLADLPEFLQGDVEEGIEADSIEDARETVANLEDRARDAEFEKTRDRKRESKSP